MEQMVESLTKESLKYEHLSEANCVKMTACPFLCFCYAGGVRQLPVVGRDGAAPPDCRHMVGQRQVNKRKKKKMLEYCNVKNFSVKSDFQHIIGCLHNT